MRYKYTGEDTRTFVGVGILEPGDVIDSPTHLHSPLLRKVREPQTPAAPSGDGTGHQAE